MIRYIDLKDQIIEGYHEFAWFDTIEDKFFNIDGSYTWHTWREFQSELVMYMVKGRVPEAEQNETLARFRRLFPKQEKNHGSKAS